MKYCTKEEYELKECILNNSIIKTQYPNNIIRINEINFRYLNFIQFSNGDMVFSSSSYPKSNKRIFFGLKKDGSFYFKNTDEAPLKYLTSDNEDENRYESANSIIISDGKEYYISMGRVSTYTEIFDFDNNKIISKKTEDLIGYNNKNMKANLLNIDKERNIYIFSGITEIDSITSAIILKFNLELETNELSFTCYATSKIDNMFGELGSCFVTEKHENIICFYLFKNDTLSSYLLLAYDNKLVKLKEEYFRTSGLNIFAYFYSVFFRENAGAFIYYRMETSGTYPNIFFKEYNIEENSFKDCFSDNNLIQLKNYIFDAGYLLNDLIKISDNKLGFFTSQNYETLFINLISIFNNNGINNIKIRYYSIENYRLLNYKLSSDIKGFIFNDFIILGFSYCTVANCINEDKYKYASQIMIIGYPNKDDENFDIINYLLSDNDNSIENITLDFSKNVTIDNNIFGFVYDGIKIQSIKSNGYIYLVSYTSNNIINNITNNIINKNDNMKIEFENKIYNKSECLLEYSIIVTEPEYEEYEKYPINISTTYGDDNEELFKTQKNQYVGKSIYYKIILTEDLTNKCNNLSCSLCFEKNISCITYRPYIEITTELIETEINTYYQTETITNKVDKTPELIKTEINSFYQTESITNKIDNLICTDKEIFENKCQNKKISDKQIEHLYDKLKDTVNKENKNNNKITIKTKNAIFQLISLEELEHKNEEDKDISTIDLGKCLDKLKESTDHPLKIIKVDIKNEDLTSTYVKYEICDSKTGSKIDLNTFCQDLTIKINVPKKLDEETIYNFVNAKNSGYELLNKDDSFYTDICTTYTSIGGKDVLLHDRYNDIYIHINEMYICQTGCELVSYNTIIEKAECDCKIQQISFEEIQFSKQMILETFLGVLKNSNFLVLKCYKLLLDFSKLLSNYGLIIMSIILLLDFILILLYIIMRKNKIIEIIKSFIKTKFNIKGENIKQEGNRINLYKMNNDIYKNGKNNNKNCKKISIKNSEINQNRNKIIKNIRKKKIIKKDINKNNFPPKKKKKNKIKLININNNIYNFNFKDNNSPSIGAINISKKPLLNKNNKVVVNKKNNITESLLSLKQSINKNNDYRKGKKKNLTIKKKFVPIFNDQEINYMEYSKAIQVDKRTYFQYYLSLLKRKQLILLAFFPNNDYNINELKISLLLLSFSLYFTINAFFFSDETMHKIYKDESSYNIMYQIPIMLYSTFISSILNIILKQLSLSENNILSIAHLQNYKMAINKSQTILKCLRIKFIIFFLLRVTILLFCWYFISCFCAVYINTQTALISDTFISYGLSMIYPFVLNLLPGIFRIPSLRAKNKDKKCLYKISNIISLI